MKADNVRNMENNNAEMEYITLPSTGIYTDMQRDQSAYYAGYNEYQCFDNNFGQNHVDNSNGHFGYCGYSASPNCASCCCGYDSKGQNSQSISMPSTQNAQNYGQVEYQYEYANQSNTGQGYNTNRCAGGMESYAPPMAYQAESSENNPSNFLCNMKQEAPSNYFTMPMNHVNPDYWSNSRNTEDNADDSIQNHTVYSSDFQPNYETGNKFNHFPNNDFMDIKMFGDFIKSSQNQSISPEYSHLLGDSTYNIDNNPDVGGIQMQSYPISNANYLQMCSS